MHESVCKSFNQQIRNEFHASHVYLGMCAYFDGENLPGFAHWMRAQSAEEVVHAMKLYDFMLDRGITPELLGVDAAPTSYPSPLAAFEGALAHEQLVTRQIEAMYELALEQRDYTAHVLLQWFINEQLEEEKSASSLVERLKMSEGSRSALLILDSELGARTGDEN